jgi:ribosomal-protein-alanine N-acetyltransferase
MIREATAADIERVLDMERSCFAEDPWTRGMLEEEVRRAGGIFLVREDLLGFVIGWNILSELHVLQIAVAPPLRRRGYGRVLLDALEAAAVGAEVAWLEVRADNAAALAMYGRADYRQVGVRPRYYGDGGDALVLRKRLVAKE